MIGPQPGSPVSPAPAVQRSHETGALPILPGPRADWFRSEAHALLVDAVWTVRGESDRIGVRLEGPRLPRAVDGELPSEPTRPGALQVPADGQPIIFGPDAPVTGGYPVIAVVADLDRVAQLRPGDRLRFARDAGLRSGWGAAGTTRPRRRPRPPAG